MFVVLLTSIVNACNLAKCISLNNQKCTTQPTLISLHHNEYTQELHHYPFVVDWCVGSCNTLKRPNKLITLNYSNKACVSNKTEDLNPNVFNKIIGYMNRKHVSYECKFKFDGSKCNSNQMWNNDKFWCECKNLKEHQVCKKYIFGILLHVVVKLVNI